MDGGCPVINNQTKSFYRASCGKCGFGNICLHPTNNKWCFFPFLCFSSPHLPPRLSSLPLPLFCFSCPESLIKIFSMLYLLQVAPVLV